MKLFKRIYEGLDAEGQMMLNSLIEGLMVFGSVIGSLLLIAYFITL
jgi:hypothetical protein